MTRTLLFVEDDALRNDPTYPGIDGWWRERFGRPFYPDWIAAQATEQDLGDHFERTVCGYIVTNSFDGYTVEHPMEAQ